MVYMYIHYDFKRTRQIKCIYRFGIRELSFLNFNTVKVPYLNLKKKVNMYRVKHIEFLFCFAICVLYANAILMLY